MSVKDEPTVPRGEAGSKATRFLALVCTICPFCILARALPKSRYARFMQQVEAHCIACRAYARMKGWPSAMGPD